MPDDDYLARLRSKGDNAYNPLSWIKGDPTIGEGTWIGAFCLIDGSGGLTIGRGCNISSGAHIITHSTVRRCVTSGGHPDIDFARTVIGNNVFVGENATILMGCNIGDQCVIGAGAVVLEGTVVPAKCTVVGNPARILMR
jgi:acetyltransferase-like isoleucine patch superfamily enzyme